MGGIGLEQVQESAGDLRIAAGFEPASAKKSANTPSGFEELESLVERIRNLYGIASPKTRNQILGRVENVLDNPKTFLSIQSSEPAKFWKPTSKGLATQWPST